MSLDDSKLATFTEADLKKHNTKEEPWLLIGGRVYNVKDYMVKHPGGVEVLVEKAGTDATEDFKQIGHGPTARNEMKKYCVGKIEGQELLSEEDLAGKTGGEGSKYLIFAIIFVVIAFLYMKKMNAEASK
ncbi:Cytochrome b5 [Diplonema papillatum]|nr:Cytochrome b5 [Diplonema papillatum]